ncbi:fimbrial protein [Pseudomonas sp. KBW05]|uniref:fimbrial protein n=1 Tax=Pseudomonas sp. KBW05 TaxID=2153360 RepID=UPI000F5AC954|nr:fimbrial protein [Pseudomonas sp. KBW05]RQO58917.1 fimbrial protein [Pseudomonas sp. KBW05]
MKYPILLASTLLALGMPIAAQARCDRFQNDTFTLNLPANITVPDSLPVGSVITRQVFSGTAPAYFANCTVATHSGVFGRYSRLQDPATGAYHTEVPGIGLRITMMWAGGGPAAFALYNQGYQQVYGKIPSFTSAEATFYKIGPVTTGTVPSGMFWEKTWVIAPERFRLQLGSPVRFVRPAATCDLAAGDVNRTITLPPIKVGDLKDVVSAGVHNFDLTATCTDASNVTFRFSGTPAPGNSLLFANTGTAGGVALWLYSRVNGVPQTISTNGTRTLAVSGNRAVLPLSAAYHKNGTVSQGTLASTTTVNITYN